jgi:hypothetical protein
VPKYILVDEFHVTVSAPSDLRSRSYAAIRRPLDEVQFQAGLRRAVREVVRRYPAPNKVRVTLSR